MTKIVNERSIHEIYHKDMTKVFDVLQGEYAISSSKNPKSVLATDYIGPCVCFLGHEPSKEVGFLAHIDPISKLEESLGNLRKNLRRIGKNLSFNVGIIGGEFGISNGMVDFLKYSIKNSRKENIKMKLTFEDSLGKNLTIRNAALDLEDGKLYSYISEINPYARHMNRKRINEITKISLNILKNGIIRRKSIEERPLRLIYFGK